MTLLERFAALLDELDRWGEIQGVLSWDQQTGLPPAGRAGRASQLALVARVHHERLQSAELADVLDALEATELSPEHARAVAWTRRAQRFAVRVPAALATRLAELRGAGFAAWLDARERRDARAFLPHLTALVDASREVAAFVEPQRTPYDVWLDQHDPGTTSAGVTALFARLAPGLRELLGAVQAAAPLPAASFSAEVAAQDRVVREVAAALGYDLNAGALGVAEHPFTVRCGPEDVRITTRFRAHEPFAGLMATLHEAGHAMFEQGLPRALAPLGLRHSPSMGLHESQSRFWENVIGRSRAFAGWVCGVYERHGVSTPPADVVHAGLNVVRPSLVRVEADEVTYNLHVAIRFALERDLLDGALDVRDLEGAWNEASARELGLVPSTPNEGFLQDVHWSQGAFGYFPSYTLGNLYAAALGARIGAELPGMWEDVAAGRFGEVLRWLRTNVHAAGATIDAPDLVARVAGPVEPVEALLSHLWSRHGTLRGLRRPR